MLHPEHKTLLHAVRHPELNDHLSALLTERICRLNLSSHTPHWSYAADGCEAIVSESDVDVMRAAIAGVVGAPSVIITQERLEGREGETTLVLEPHVKAAFIAALMELLGYLRVQDLQLYPPAFDQP